jgi:geranylgeranyl diphosphate synthase type II
MHASSSAAIQQIMAATARRVDLALDRFTQFNSGCPPRLAEAIRYSLLAPGKRLRPTLVLWSAEACGCNEEQAMPAACAMEMVHCYSLVHDDLPAMDNDDLRRGRPTLHRAYDEATAILAGDALLALAFEVLARHTEPAQVAAECCSALAHAAGVAGLVGGQADDLDPQSRDGDLRTLERIHERKTGAVIQVSLRLGALIAHADHNERSALETFGRNLGVAFQIADDILDVQGQEATLGKRVGKDSAQGKLTYPALLGVDESARRARLMIDQACAAIVCFGSRGGKLEALARYVLERNH